MIYVLRAHTRRLSWMMVLLLGALVPAPAEGQSYEISSNEALWLNADYHMSDDVSAIAIGMDMDVGDGAPGFGWQAGVTFGPASGSYGGELSSSVLRDAAASQMSGSTLDRYEAPDDTDGGFLLGGKAMGVYYFDTNQSLSVGPRASYYTAQEISVLTVSSGGGYEYTEFAQVPYREAVLIPGIELQIKPGTELGFRYAYFFRGEGEPAMHMFGVGWALPM